MIKLKKLINEDTDSEKKINDLKKWIPQFQKYVEEVSHFINYNGTPRAVNNKALNVGLQEVQRSLQAALDLANKIVYNDTFMNP